MAIETIRSMGGMNIVDYSNGEVNLGVDINWIQRHLPYGTLRYGSTGYNEYWDGNSWTLAPNQPMATTVNTYQPPLYTTPTTNTKEDKALELLKALAANPMLAKDDDYELVERAFSLVDAFEEVLKSREKIGDAVRL